MALFTAPPNRMGLVLFGGDTLDVNGGGLADLTTINAGGTENVNSGGTATNTTINGGVENVNRGGVSDHATINTFGFEFVNVGVSQFTTINNGGAQHVLEFGTAQATTINDGGSEVVFNGGATTGTTINGGTETVFTGGVSKSTTIINGGVENVEGGKADQTTIKDGVLRVDSGGSATNTTINDGGAVAVFDGTADLTTIKAGGSERVFAGGTATRTTINDGGVETVLGGGVSDHTTINIGGAEDVFDHSLADHTVINGGELRVGNTATVTNTTINNGGVENVGSGGTATNTTINNGGVENVEGVSAHTTINNGGVENVGSGGTAINTTINNGGVENVDLSGRLDTVIFDTAAPASSGPGATINLENPGSLQGEVHNWHVGDVVDFLNTKVDSVHEQGSHLTVTFLRGNEPAEATYTLVDQQANTQFQLQPDDHGGTKLILTAAVLRSQPFSPETAGTIVYTAEFGSAPDATELNVLSQFAQAQFAYGQQIGVQDAAVYAFEALGVALASGQQFQNKFGPSNSTYPASTAGDAQFVTDAYTSVFGHVGTAAQIQHFAEQLSFVEGLYTAAGTFGSASNIDLLARGAIYGQMLGIEHESGLGETPPGPVFVLTTGRDTIDFKQNDSTVTGTFGLSLAATWTPGDWIIADPFTTDQTFDIQGIGAAGVIDVTSLAGNKVLGVQNVNIFANIAGSGFFDQAVHGDFTSTGPEREWTGLAQLVVNSGGGSAGADNLTVGPNTAVQITDTVDGITGATSEALTVNGSSTTTITENNVAANAGITVNGGIGTTAVSITQTEAAVGNDGIVNIVDVNGASTTDSGKITKIVLDGLSHSANSDESHDIGPNSIVDNALTDLTVKNSDTTPAMPSDGFLPAVGLIITNNLTTPTATSLILRLSHDGIDAQGAAASTLAITDLNNVYSTVHLLLGSEDSSLFLNFNGLITLDTSDSGTGALWGYIATHIDQHAVQVPSIIFDNVAAAVNFDFSGLSGPNEISVNRNGAGSHADVYTLGNFGTDNGFFRAADDINPRAFQFISLSNDAIDNAGTLNFGSGAYEIITGTETIANSKGAYSFVQTAANGAGLANLNTGAQWATISDLDSKNSDTLTFQTDNVQKFVNLGELEGSTSAISAISAGIGEALKTSAHTVVEFTFEGNTFIFDHADGSLALTPADAMVELTGIHPIAAISAAHEITFAA